LPTPREHIEGLRSDRTAYLEAAVLEGLAWGRMFSDDRMKALREEDQAAGRQLRAYRFVKALPAIVQSRKLRFERGLSLACGTGRLERQLISLGVCDGFQGLDVSEGAIAAARTAAEAEQLEITYGVGDLNHVELEKEGFDLVVTQNCLHHVVELEHLAEQIWRCLKPGGMLWIHDFVGESQFQWSDARLDVANRIWASLPERYRRNRRDGRAQAKLERPTVGNLASPFEAIRSAEILAVFQQRFEIEFRAESDAVLFLVFPFATRANYLETEDGPLVFELLMMIDRLLTEYKILPPLSGQYLLKKSEASL
jgi:SAM-dependent methyltransferase